MEFSKRQRKEITAPRGFSTKKNVAIRARDEGRQKKEREEGKCKCGKKEASVSMMVWFRCTPWSGAALGSGRLSWYGKVKLETLVHTTMYYI